MRTTKVASTLVEVLTIIAIVAIMAGVIVTAVKRSNAKPEVITVKHVGQAEVSQTRTITKVPYAQIETFLSGVPSEIQIVQVVPVYRGCGDSFDINYYIVITEKQ